jgi:uncharacterized SAM-binding protein YcdF (DUF218 family)
VLLLLRVKTVVKSLILPPTGALLVALLGLFLLKRRPLMARTLLALGLGSLWLLSTPVVGDILAGFAEHYPPLDWRRAADAQAIVILGGGGQRTFAPEYAGPAAEPALLERLSYGAFVARKTRLPILVTGFRIEASAMQATLQRNFALEPRWIDDQAYDTFQNASNSARLLRADGVHRIVLVTHATHMWRAVHEFTDAGMDVVPAPVGILAARDIGIRRYLPSPDTLPRSTAAINELLGEPLRAIFAATHMRRQ